MGILRRIARNAVVVLLARSIEMGSGMLIMAILCRYLKAELFGEYAFISALILAFQPLVNLELNTILVREMSRDLSRQGSLLGAALILKIMLLVGFIIGCVFLDNWLGFHGGMRAAFYLAMLGETGQQIHWVFSAVYLSRQRMEFETMTTLLHRVISILGIVCIAAVDHAGHHVHTGFILIFLVLAVGHAARAVYSVFIAVSRILKSRIEWNWSGVRPLISEMWIMGIATFFTSLSFRIDVYFLKAYRGAEAVSMFHVPHMVVLQVQILAVSLVTALFPLMSRWGADAAFREQFNLTRNLAVRTLSIMGFSITLVFALFADWIIQIVGGGAFGPSIACMRILAWCVPILFLNFIVAGILISLGRQDLLIYGAVSSLVLNVVLDWLWVPVMGEIGASYATVISYTLQIVLLLGFQRYVERQSMGVISAVAYPMLISMAGVFAGYRFFMNLPMKPIWMVAIGMVCTGTMVMIQPAELRRMIITRLQRRHGPPPGG